MDSNVFLFFLRVFTDRPVGHGNFRSTISYGDLELFLSGLELGKLIPLFQDHKVKFADLLRMTDGDLQKVKHKTQSI